MFIFRSTESGCVYVHVYTDTITFVHVQLYVCIHTVPGYVLIKYVPLLESTNLLQACSVATA